MQITPFKRLISEDYDKQYASLVEKLGGALNAFCDDVFNAFNNNLSIDDNFNQVKKSITVTVNATGTPATPLKFKSGLKSNCYGITVVAATNQTSASTYPTSYPFFSFTQSDGIITVNNISGLQANNIYLLSLILF